MSYKYAIIENHLRSQSLRAADWANRDAVRCAERASAWSDTRAARIRARKHAVSSIRLLIDTNVVRQSAQQVQFSFHPSQDLLAGREELDPAQTPQVSYHRSTQVAQKTGVRHQEVDDEDDEERCCPGRNGVVADGEGWVLAVRLDCFDAEEQEYPDACANDRRVAAEDKTLQDGVDGSWEQAKRSGEQKESHDRAILHLEALEQRRQGDAVEQEVEDILMQ